MPVLAWIVFFTFLGGVLSALAASVLLLFSKKRRVGLLPHLVSFATGALLGAAFLGLLPHALDGAGVDSYHRIGATVLSGILVFFLLEKLVLWRHCHHDDCEAHGPSDQHRASASGVMILVGDGIHNFLDGLLIAAAFLTDIHLGVVTAIAVIAHEIPQEVGDLAVLLNAGLKRGKAFTLNLLVSLTSVLGGIAGWAWLDQATELLPYVLAIAASSFLYIAVADLIPGLHRNVEARASLLQVLLIAAGVFVVAVTHQAVH
ncbi:MAG: ZIP family metal transporter [Gammaproteobacteria bacterium]|nr:ZIP family metal transporter [Pseudomonadota bacterium]MCZ6536346.1 ZIP family metal transporter [Gammaproteobacteria bacterium]MCH8896643.1 ZIP family metal transporter [Pseudomonadota bacterium]MCZ6687240.1 ZIP family metal transporter [Gammaproteobacteria bacterium]MCZ6762659.1 ZIP family metal transporter [Gammaproteobacteria bacterium]